MLHSAVSTEVPLPLLLNDRWLDKPTDNNPDLYYNLCLKICAETDQAYKARRMTTKVVDALYSEA